MRFGGVPNKRGIKAQKRYNHGVTWQGRDQKVGDSKTWYVAGQKVNLMGMIVEGPRETR